MSISQPKEEFIQFTRNNNDNAAENRSFRRVGFDIFEILRNEVDEKLIGMLTEPPAEGDNNATVAAKLLYSSCMNEGTN